MKLTVFLVILLLVQVYTETCLTPNQEEAECKSLYTCSILLQALISQQKEVIDFVRQSHCGTWSSDTHPLVCCGTHASFVKTKPSKISISDLRFCGYQHTDDYFYTGNITAIDEFPWLAVFKYERDSDLEDVIDDNFVEFGCSGSLITADYVLTAAQCLRLRTSKAVAVRLGEYNIKHEVDCVKFSEIDECSNPYNRRLGIHDIALLKLNRSVTFTDYIRPICLPIPGTKFAQTGDTMTMTGFGREGTYKNYAMIKKKILTKLISGNQCIKEFSVFKDSTRHVTENIMCTKDLENSERACEGDSGGPLMFSQHTQWHIEETCLTPNQEIAECKSLYTCPTMLQALVSREKAVIDFVRQSHCGTWSSDIHPLVCCGTQTNFVKNETTKDMASVRVNTTNLISDLRYCGYQHTDDYFYTGNVTAIDEFPWLAVLKYQRDSDLGDIKNDRFVEFGCSGSLITANYVLTAAQCLRLRTSKAVAVRLGEYNIKHNVDCVKFSEMDDCSNPVEDISIEKRIKHPKYNRRLGTNDIALLKLNRSVTFTDYIRPICLPIPGIKFAQVGDTMTMTGFGRVGTYKNYAMIKKRISTKLISANECIKELSVLGDNSRQVTENIMCTKDLQRSERACEGDSGGPLMFSQRTQWHIEGIAVWSINFCETDFPFAYTKVVNYLDWIQKIVSG
ncbi:hypothetical protein RN001_007075 [Aquatica leii]|uniref:CLIP domain-containing serine protease n=1 Tax=Aquatica leii TaxID=1421715 RepID=A0AAN7PVZ5_9COLE|nr:hypothetical protein RN001_007075 [Aquatica leii]